MSNGWKEPAAGDATTRCAGVREKRSDSARDQETLLLHPRHTRDCFSVRRPMSLIHFPAATTMHEAGSSADRQRHRTPFMSRLFRDKRHAEHSLRAEFESSVRHSHRNSKPRQQMVMAESLFDPEVPVANKSRLILSLSDLHEDRFAQAYFDAYGDRQAPETSHLIKLWLRISRLRGTAGEQRMPAADMHDMGRRARLIVNRCATDQNILNMLPEGLIDKLESQTRTPDLMPEIFDPVLEAIRPVVQTAFTSFLSSQFFLKYQIDIMTKGHITLSDVLFDDQVLFYFMDFMEEESMRKYADFLLIIHSYRNADSREMDAQVIWNKFFRNEPNSRLDESSHCLYLSESVCEKVWQEILGQQPHCFEFPARLVHQYLEKTYFKQFLESHSYFSMTTEWIERFQRMQIDSSASDLTHKPMMGTSVAESTSSDLVTDPASGQTDSAVSAGKPVTVYDEQMWSRGWAGTLQILHVDRYGRVISDLEPQPGKRQNTSYISNSLRKLVTGSVSNQDTNQAVAWKIAQMIIDDVINVTQGNT